ncbi:Resolvase domain protein [Rippkaea orientalis PCC 8801]|uniref:Resolvase domain protein n=1 Tax=Rippkaea orientalis (strain PCC 8801 / RF-1) TaxID=41431 RepID=B7K2C3_RIPO1|nr:recombinase family protein [Rippkaea orientalis]ACK65259.1 Resolvase domain protein [Rippkaea orientalis PCC 8801]
MSEHHLYTLEESAELFDVSSTTMLQWEQEGKLAVVETTPDNYKYNISEFFPAEKTSMMTIGYVRVSTQQNDYDLARQIAILKVYFQEQGWNYQILQDIGKKGSFRHPGLIHLLKLICNQQVQRLVLTNKHKLLGLGSDFVLTLCEVFHTQVVILNTIDEEYVPTEITEDLKGVIDLFKSRIGDNPNPERQELLKELKAIAGTLST